MAGPWEKYGAQPAAPQASADPIVKPADPYKANAEARAQAGEARAAEDQAFQREKFAFEKAKAEQETSAKADTLDPKTQTGQRNIATGILKSIGIDFAAGKDPVADYILKSTSGPLQKFGADVYGAVTGDATTGMENIGRLRSIAADMTLQMTGGSLGTGFSNADRDFISERMGDVANPNKTDEERLAAWDEVKKRLAQMSGVEYRPLVSDNGEEGLTGSVTDDSPNVDPNAIQVTRGGAGPDGGGAPDWAKSLYAGVGDLAESAGDVYGIVANPFIATYNAVTGNNYNTDTGQSFRNAIGAPQGNETASAINQGAAGALMFGGLARGASNLATGVTQNALSTFAARPILDTAAGGAAGAGAEVGRRTGIPGGEAIGTLAGGLAGYSGAQRFANAVAPKVPTAVAQAAERQGVQMIPGDTGGTATRILTSGAKASPLSAGPIRTQARQSQAQLEQAASRASASQGERLTTDKAGEAVRQAATNYIERTSARGETLYNAAYQSAGGVRAIKPVKTIQALDEQIARLKQNPTDEAAGMVGELTAFRDRIANGVSIQGLRDARTSLSAGVYDGKLRSGQVQGMWKNILGNVAEDIDAGLRSAGKGKAAELFKRADAFHRERVQHIDQVLSPLLGREKGGEQIIETLEQMARGKAGGNARLSRLLGEMSPQEASQIRATLIERIGKAAPGQQDETGQVFSSDAFLTNWNKMTPQAKASLFPSEEMRRNLNDIALISANMKQSNSMANFSNTAMAVGGGGQSVGAVALGVAVSPIASAVIGGGQYLTGKLLASPGFARWLARAPKNPRAAMKYSEQLSVLGTREPLIANDAKVLQEYLSQAFSQSPGRAAAQEEDNGRVKPPQQ